MGKDRSQETGDRRQDKWELYGEVQGKIMPQFFGNNHLMHTNIHDIFSPKSWYFFQLKNSHTFIFKYFHN